MNAFSKVTGKNGVAMGTHSWFIMNYGWKWRTPVYPNVRHGKSFRAEWENVKTQGNLPSSALALCAVRFDK